MVRTSATFASSSADTLSGCTVIMSRPTSSSGRVSELGRHFAEAVAERTGDGPRAVAPLEVAIDEQRGAYGWARIEMRLEARVHGNLTRVMVIEIAHGGPRLEECEKPGAIHIERNIEHGAFVARRRTNAIE